MPVLESICKRRSIWHGNPFEWLGNVAVRPSHKCKWQHLLILTPRSVGCCLWLSVVGFHCADMAVTKYDSYDSKFVVASFCSRSHSVCWPLLLLHFHRSFWRLFRGLLPCLIARLVDCSALLLWFVSIVPLPIAVFWLFLLPCTTFSLLFGEFSWFIKSTQSLAFSHSKENKRITLYKRRGLSSSDEFLSFNSLEPKEPDFFCLEAIEKTLSTRLLDFQKYGVAFGISHNGRCMIADDMGLG